MPMHWPQFEVIAILCSFLESGFCSYLLEHKEKQKQGLNCTIKKSTKVVILN